MDTDIVISVGGQNFNRFKQEVIPCKTCGRSTTMLGTKQCDRCYELDSRIRSDPDLARKLLAQTDWIRTTDQVPENGRLIVKRWANGNVWAGVHVAHPKHESFDEWLPLPN